jgi:membrane protein required for colicin V production
LPDVQHLPFTVVDLAVIGIIALSALLALARGAVREVLGLASWIGSIAVAFVAFERVRPLVTPHIQEPLIADAATLAIVFIVPFIAFKILASVIAGAVSASPLGPFDRLLGFGFGVLRGMLIVCAAYLVVSAFVPPARQPVWLRDARTLPQVQKGAALLTQALPQGMRVFDQVAEPTRATDTGEPPPADRGRPEAQRQAVTRPAAPKPQL